MIDFTINPCNRNRKGINIMNSTTKLFYPMIIVVCLFLIYTSEKKRRKYKKENMRILHYLNQDDKTMRIISSLMLIIMVTSSVVLLIDIARTIGLFSMDALYIVLLPFLFICLYVPLSRNTKITTLGIIKRTNLIRWEEIKGIDYLKPDSKGKQKVKILHKGPYKDTLTEITFNIGDEQFESFKNTAKDYRNKKHDNKLNKKDKKSGKDK